MLEFFMGMVGVCITMFWLSILWAVVTTAIKDVVRWLIELPADIKEEAALLKFVVTGGWKK